MADRLVTQALCLEAAARLIAAIPGPVLEIGLGKGRTYDHLRALLPDREIFAFDRAIHAPRALVPGAGHLILGEVTETLPTFARRLGRTAALAHADLGTESRTGDAALAGSVARLLVPVMAAGGVVLSDRAMDGAGWAPLALPGAARWPYFMYRV